MSSAQLLNIESRLRNIMKAGEQDQVLQAVSYGPDVSTMIMTFGADGQRVAACYS